MKALIAGSLVAFTLFAATPASALNIHVGPRGVGVGVGHRVHHGYRHHRFHHHGYRHHGYRHHRHY